MAQLPLNSATILSGACEFDQETAGHRFLAVSTRDAGEWVPHLIHSENHTFAVVFLHNYYTKLEVFAGSPVPTRDDSRRQLSPFRAVANEGDRAFLRRAQLALRDGFSCVHAITDLEWKRCAYEIAPEGNLLALRVNRRYLELIRAALCKSMGGGPNLELLKVLNEQGLELPVAVLRARFRTASAGLRAELLRDLGSREEQSATDFLLSVLEDRELAEHRDQCIRALQHAGDSDRDSAARRAARHYLADLLGDGE